MQRFRYKSSNTTPKALQAQTAQEVKDLEGLPGFSPSTGEPLYFVIKIGQFKGESEWQTSLTGGAAPLKRKKKTTIHYKSALR